MKHQSYDQACQGYGVYAGMGVVPSAAEVLQNLDKYIVIEGGIQMLRSDLRKPAVDALGKTTLALVGSDGPLLQGTATADLMGLNIGGGWAADYLAEGYAIMGDRTSIGKGLTGNIMMAKAPGYIADNASKGGNYIVIDGPQQLLLDAQKLAGGIPPGIPGSEIPPGGVLPEEKDKQPEFKAGAAPTWLVPAVVGVGLLTLGAFAVSARKK